METDHQEVKAARKVVGVHQISRASSRNIMIPQRKDSDKSIEEKIIDIKMKARSRNKMNLKYKTLQITEFNENVHPCTILTLNNNFTD